MPLLSDFLPASSTPPKSQVYGNKSMTTGDNDAKMAPDADDCSEESDNSGVRPSDNMERNWTPILSSPVFSSWQPRSAADPQPANNNTNDDTSVDAALHPADSIKEQISGKRRIYPNFFFSNCSTEALNQIFPIQRGKGDLEPPVSFQTSVTKMREWRRMGRKEQGSWGKNETHQEDDSPATECRQLFPAASAKPPWCKGITLEFLLSTKRQDPVSLKDGFCKLIGNAKHSAASACSQGREWPLDPKIYHGVLDKGQGNKKKDDQDMVDIGL